MLLRPNSRQLMLDIARVMDSLGWTSDTVMRRSWTYNFFWLRQAQIWVEWSGFHALRNPLPYTAASFLMFLMRSRPRTYHPKKVRNAWPFYRQSSAPRNARRNIEVWEFPLRAAFTRNYAQYGYFTRDELAGDAAS